MSWTLSLYVAKRFLGTVLATFGAVFVLVVIVDTVELLRRSGNVEVGFDTLLLMAVFHAPAITITAAPFTILLAAMACFTRMARASELVVTRAAGVSVWRITAPAVLAAVGLGIFSFAVYNPVASAMSGRFQAMEERIFDRSSSRLMVSDAGLWLRQADTNGQTIIHARTASSTIDRLWQVVVFRWNDADEHYARINARTAVLEPGVWRLSGVREWNLLAPGVAPTGEPGEPKSTAAPLTETMVLPTDLTPERIEESFADPQTISFWELPRFIATLNEQGFSAARHNLHFQSLLAAPVVFAAMVLIAAAFSMRHARFGGLGSMAMGCVVCGFVYYVLSDISLALGATGTVPVALAAWAPPASAVLMSIGLLLHLEDG